MNNKLPADPTSIILGILALVLILLGCCCGLLGIVSLIISIIGLVMANKSISEYRLNPDNYFYQSARNVNTGRILSIIGIILSGLLLLTSIVFYSFFGYQFYDKIFEEIRNKKNINYEVNDSINEYSVDQDSIYVDSVEFEKTELQNQ